MIEKSWNNTPTYRGKMGDQCLQENFHILPIGINIKRKKKPYNVTITFNLNKNY